MVVISNYNTCRSIALAISCARTDALWDCQLGDSARYHCHWSIPTSAVASCLNALQHIPSLMTQLPKFKTNTNQLH
jgi:hypothetical protein